MRDRLAGPAQADEPAREVVMDLEALDLPREQVGLLRRPAGEAADGHLRPAVPGEDGAWDAATRYTVRKCWEKNGAAVAMVETHPETGRHHQIRAHLRSIGTPILFDRLYGPRSAGEWETGSPVSRLALHASRLVVPDASQADMTRTIEAPLAADLAALVHWLDRDWTTVAIATFSPE